MTDGLAPGARRRVGLALLGTAAAVAYPVVVYLGLTRWSARGVGLALVGVGLVGVAARRGPARGLAGPGVGAVALAGLAALAAATGDGRFVLAVPVVISAGLLAGFGASLASGRTPIVERFARRRAATLSPAQRAWCRRVTQVWCGFFVANGLAALALALAAPTAWWAAYTGGIAYALIGALLAGEYLLRRRRFGARGRAP